MPMIIYYVVFEEKSIHFWPTFLLPPLYILLAIFFLWKLIKDYLINNYDYSGSLIIKKNQIVMVVFTKITLEKFFMIIKNMKMSIICFLNILRNYWRRWDIFKYLILLNFLLFFWEIYFSKKKLWRKHLLYNLYGNIICIFLQFRSFSLILIPF
jgi:chromate transport protein ChrA